MRIIYLIFLFFIFSCKSQKVTCDTICKENIVYVTFEIKSKDLYPVVMSAFFDNYSVNDFNKKDAESFVKSFYKMGIYTPTLMKGYEKISSVCYDPLPSTITMSRNKKTLLKIAKIFDRQNGKTLILDSGDKVILKSINVSGCFFNVDKNNSGIFTNSMEWDILTIDEIKKVLIPFYKMKIPDLSAL